MSDSPEKKSWKENDKAQKAWGVLLFGLIGATATTFAISQLRRSVEWMSSQFNRMQSSASWRSSTSSSNSSRQGFNEDAWKRYNRRIQEEYEDEMERLQRIRRMQSVFNRERNKYKRGYESWRENNGSGGYHYVPRDDWYWKTDTSHSYQKARSTAAPHTRTYPMSHHYAILGLDRSRSAPYTDAEIKTAFRMKAMECHPDQNQDNKDAAEEKFKEVMKSYEAIKQERKTDM
ncbi:DnaJ subfamily B member 6-A [Carex littledalei]|uniref:DnaJ subfamily B member 6-A n=1 Tax=Carex littledalei TaxID=544730 RepID=A0A833V236_9POAL|nr:DnaJ subfamily B member 6-A [Carex littledalei]